MAPPNLPWIVQWNPDDSDPATPWTMANVNALSTKVQKIEIDRNTFRGTLRASTASITVTDEGYNLRPGKVSGAYYPNVMVGRRVRVLAQPSPSSWQPWFFGYIREIQPNVDDSNPPTCTLLCDGPLGVLADRNVTLPPVADYWVYDADDTAHSALSLLLDTVALSTTALVSLENTAGPRIVGAWGNATKTFAQWLSELCAAANTVVSDEPLYASGAGDPDWHLHWFRVPPLAPAAWTWSAHSRELELLPQLVFNGDLPPP